MSSSLIDLQRFINSRPVLSDTDETEPKDNINRMGHEECPRKEQ
jgi:hypothetical protein